MKIINTMTAAMTATMTAAMTMTKMSIRISRRQMILGERRRHYINFEEIP
jgi:hypothetical protein